MRAKHKFTSSDI